MLAKANDNKPYSMWVSLTGDREYALVSYHAKLAELDAVRTDDPKLKDQKADLIRIAARIFQCAEESRRYVGEMDKDLSLPSAKDTPKMISVLRVHPDKVDQYLALAKSELLPAVKRSGVKAYSVTRTRYGGSRADITTVVGVDSWADLDGTSPIVKAMGADAYQKYLNKVRPLMQDAEYNVYRYQPELSYLPNMAASGSTTGSR